MKNFCPQELPEVSSTSPRSPTETATPTSEAHPSAAGAEEPFEPYSVQSEKVNLQGVSPI